MIEEGEKKKNKIGLSGSSGAFYTFTWCRCLVLHICLYIISPLELQMLILLVFFHILLHIANDLLNLR